MDVNVKILNGVFIPLIAFSLYFFFILIFHTRQKVLTAFAAI